MAPTLVSLVLSAMTTELPKFLFADDCALVAAADIGGTSQRQDTSHVQASLHQSSCHRSVAHTSDSQATGVSQYSFQLSLAQHRQLCFFPVINEKELSNESSVTAACKHGIYCRYLHKQGRSSTTGFRYFFLKWSSPGWAASKA